MRGAVALAAALALPLGFPSPGPAATDAALERLQQLRAAEPTRDDAIERLQGVYQSQHAAVRGPSGRRVTNVGHRRSPCSMANRAAAARVEAPILA